MQDKVFVCDAMCSELGRWLRIAGYDTEIVRGSVPDEEIYKKAVAENKVVVTRDRVFKERYPQEKRIIYLRTEDIEQWAVQLRQELGVDWLFAPFSRCLECNSLLEKSEEPENAPADIKEFWICPSCKHVYWRGSHTQRMEARLIGWQQEGED